MLWGKQKKQKQKKVSTLSGDHPSRRPSAGKFATNLAMMLAVGDAKKGQSLHPLYIFSFPSRQQPYATEMTGGSVSRWKNKKTLSSTAGLAIAFFAHPEAQIALRSNPLRPGVVEMESVQRAVIMLMLHFTRRHAFCAT